MEKKERINVIIEQHQAILLNYATRILGRPDIAQDVVQDTFIKLCQSDFETIEAYVKPWLFKVCRNRALEVIRKDKKMSHLPMAEFDCEDVEEPLPTDKITPKESKKIMLLLLNELPENQREILYLRFTSGMSDKEISEATNQTVSNVGVLIHTAMKTLKEKALQKNILKELHIGGVK